MNADADDVTIELLSTALQTTAPSEFSTLVSQKIEMEDESICNTLISHWTKGLNNEAATIAYRSAIESNVKLFYGKTVLDIRGGTGN